MSKQSKHHNAHHAAIFGEVLVDHFPDGQQVLGGAPFNVAWHLQAFGQCPCFISRVGNDAIGKNIRQAMIDWGMSVDSLQTDPVYPTGAVKVTISNDEPTYEILADQAYDYINVQQPVLANPFSIIYHGTLALRERISEQTLNGLIKHYKGKVFIDANLRAPWWNQELVDRWLGKANWVKLNHDELMQLVPPQNTTKDAMQLFVIQHDLDVLIVTCGSEGAMAINKDGEFFEVTPASNLPFVDTVGAGDAFSAVMLLGILQDWPLSVAMDRAQSFASALISHRGAIVQNLNFYQTFMSAWNLG